MEELTAFVCVTTALAAVHLSGAEEPDLVAHYTFDEGSGTVLHDHSGNGNEGRTHNARWVRQGEGYCLEFNGVDSYVDCGRGSSLDLRDVITLEAWIYPSRRVQGEPGILGKHFTSFLLTYYRDGKCWWYIDEGANNAKSLLTAGAWHHVVGTFDGTTLKLYVDGKLTNSQTSRHPAINSGGNFFIGCVVGDPNAEDPAYTHTTYFPGRIDEVSVFHRVLPAEEVQARFQAGVQKLSLMAAFRPVEARATLRRGEATVKVGGRGEVQVDVSGEPCLVESSFSYPGPQTGWNFLSGQERSGDPGWKPTVRKISSQMAHIEAQGQFFHLSRKVMLRPGKVEFEDRVTNLRDAPTGSLIENRLIVPAPFEESFTPGGAENPTLYLKRKNSSLGVLLEDNVSRLQFQPALGLPANQAKFRLANFGLDAHRSYTFRWTLYLLDGDAGYFDFINRVRGDWKTNFTLEGPFSFFDLNSPLLNDPAALKAYLQRKRLKIVALSPWLDYDPGSFDHVWPREEYKERMQKAIRAFREVDPTIRCVGCIETDWVTIYPAQMKGGGQLPQAVPGEPRPSGRLTPEQTKIIDDANLPWKDSVKRDVDGNLELELYVRGGQPQTALSVYPAVGNYQYEFLLGQVKFLLDEVGFDGFYIDEFSQGWGGASIRTYAGWDGLSVDLDPLTGEIAEKYVDCSLAGVEARLQLCEYALQRGKTVIANTYATAMEEQALPIQRFSETQGSFDPFAVAEGVEPPSVPDCFRGHLATPIGLGIVGVPGKQDTARRIMRAIVTYLRHGMVYYHYAIGDIPETGEGSGEYGPINRMFPITPLGLHKGWIEGRERTITCVSGDYAWRRPDRPTVHLFDLDGREKGHHFTLTRSDRGWTVQVRLRDWAEIAIIE